MTRPSLSWLSRDEGLTSQASRHSQEVLSASSEMPLPPWSQFYCFYYFNSFPSGLPYLPMQNWFRDATFGAHYVVMATRILKFISPPFLPSMNSLPSLTTYVFCMRSKTQKTVGPLSSSGSIFFLLILSTFQPSMSLTGGKKLPPSSLLCVNIPRLPVACGCPGARVGEQPSAAPPSPSQEADRFIPAYKDHKHTVSCFSYLAPPKHSRQLQL